MSDEKEAPNESSRTMRGLNATREVIFTLGATLVGIFATLISTFVLGAGQKAQSSSWGVAGWSVLGVVFLLVLLGAIGSFRWAQREEHSRGATAADLVWDEITLDRTAEVASERSVEVQ